MTMNKLSFTSYNCHLGPIWRQPLAYQTFVKDLIGAYILHHCKSFGRYSVGRNMISDKQILIQYQ